MLVLRPPTSHVMSYDRTSPPGGSDLKGAFTEYSSCCTLRRQSCVRRWYLPCIQKDSGTGSFVGLRKLRPNWACPRESRPKSLLLFALPSCEE